MSGLDVHLGVDELVFEIGGGRYAAPAGVQRLARSIGGDPPDPADLTNAIGLVLDHLDDVDRELPMAAFAEGIRVTGPGARVVAEVEVGTEVTLPFELSPEALEDVFRTMATERRADRAHNPGLPAEWVHDVLGACCALVAVARRYRPPHLVVDA